MLTCSRECQESASDTVEIEEVAAEDMEIILKFIYGVLDALPEERLQSLVLATDRLQVRYLPSTDSHVRNSPARSIQDLLRCACAFLPREERKHGLDMRAKT